jgi:hypothetical protein
MDLSRTPPGTRTPWVQVDACTLPTSAQPLRMAEWDDLFATSTRTVEHSDPSATDARLVLAGDGQLAARAQRLADAETACCSFFTFTVTLLDADRNGRTVVALDVRVPEARADVLAALVDRARRGAP